MHDFLISLGICVSLRCARPPRMNACSSLSEFTVKRFFRAPVIFSRKSKSFLLASPLPTFLKLKCQSLRDHSRSIRQIPCTLPYSAWAPEENNHGRAPRCWSFFPSEKRKRRRKRRKCQAGGNTQHHHEHLSFYGFLLRSFSIEEDFK